MLAATLSPSYGIYSGYEACENIPVREGSEEYLELREVRGQAALAAGAAAAADPPAERDPARAPRAPAVREPHAGSTRTATSSSRTQSGRARMSSSPSSTSIPRTPRRGSASCPPRSGCPTASLAVDLLSDTAFRWRTGRNYVGLPPGGAHVIAVAPEAGRGTREWACLGRRSAGPREPARAPRAGRAARARRRPALVLRHRRHDRRARRSPHSSRATTSSSSGSSRSPSPAASSGTYLVALGRTRRDALERPARLSPPARARGVRSPCAYVRPAGLDQTNSAVVVDEAYVLKLYRRIEDGPAVEAELLEVLERVGFDSALSAARPRSTTAGATLAIVTEYVPSRRGRLGSGDGRARRRRRGVAAAAGAVGSAR